MTTPNSSSDDAREYADQLQNILDHGPDWFEVADPLGDELRAVHDSRISALVRSRGKSLTPEFIEMALPWGDRGGIDDRIRSEIHNQILHEVAVIKDAESNETRPAVERIQARRLPELISNCDDPGLARLAAQLERSAEGTVSIEDQDVVPGFRWRLVSSPVERWMLARQTPSPAVCDTFWAGRGISAGKSELWVLESEGCSEPPLIQVLVDCRHPGIAEIWGKTNTVPEQSIPALLSPLIHEKKLRPWRVGDENGSWPVWHNPAITGALRKNYE